MLHVRNSWTFPARFKMMTMGIRIGIQLGGEKFLNRQAASLKISEGSVSTPIRRWLAMKSADVEDLCSQGGLAFAFRISYFPSTWFMLAPVWMAKWIKLGSTFCVSTRISGSKLFPIPQWVRSCPDLCRLPCPALPPRRLLSIAQMGYWWAILFGDLLWQVASGKLFRTRL